MLQTPSELLPQIAKIFVFRAVIPGKIEVQPRASLSEKNYTAFESMSVTYLVVDIRSLACQVGEQELGSLDLAKDTGCDHTLVLNVIGLNGSNVELFKDLFNRISDRRRSVPVATCP